VVAVQAATAGRFPIQTEVLIPFVPVKGKNDVPPKNTTLLRLKSLLRGEKEVSRKLWANAEFFERMCFTEPIRGGKENAPVRLHRRGEEFEEMSARITGLSLR
jgi:hypothetical protein